MKLTAFLAVMIASYPVLAETPVPIMFQNDTGIPIHIQVNKDASPCWDWDKTDKALTNGTTLPVGQSSPYTAWTKSSWGCAFPGTSILFIKFNAKSPLCQFTLHGSKFLSPGDCGGFKKIDVNSEGDAGNIITIPKQ